MHADFLAAICADPDDLTHRLVYADWLTDNGASPLDAARADLIRVQIAREQADEDGEEYWTLRARERVLLATWGKPLARPLTDPVRFRRGFPEEVRLSAAAFNRGAQRLAKRAPIRHARLSNNSALANDAVAGLRGLDLIHPPEAARLWLPSRRQLAGLESFGLELDTNPPSPRPLGPAFATEVRQLFAAPSPARLRSLRLQAPVDLWEGGFPISRFAWLGQLDAFQLDGQLAFDFAELTCCPAARRLRSFACGWLMDFRRPLGRELVELRELDLPWLDFGTLARVHLPELRVLRTGRAWGELERPCWPRLHTLDLGRWHVLGHHLTPFLQEPDRRPLRRLRGCLPVNHLEILRGGYEELPPERQGLRELVLVGKVSDRTLETLTGSALLAGLTTLEFPNGTWRPETLLRLAAPAVSPRLTWLDARGPQLPADAAGRLRERFGAGLRTGKVDAHAVEGWY